MKIKIALLQQYSCRCSQKPGRTMSGQWPTDFHWKLARWGAGCCLQRCTRCRCGQNRFQRWRWVQSSCPTVKNRQWWWPPKIIISNDGYINFFTINTLKAKSLLLSLPIINAHAYVTTRHLSLHLPFSSCFFLPFYVHHLTVFKSGLDC